MNEQLPLKMPLAGLIPHPLQSTFYDDCSPADDQELAADLKKRGQQSPIIIMPPDNAAGLQGGTILDGCRRAAGLKANGQTEAWVLVRHDLKNADTATVEIEFLKFNTSRRQLHPLDKARVIKRLYELERKRPSGRFNSFERSHLRDRIGKAMDMSGRNLDRYMRVLETPKAIQDAVRDGRLTLVLGSRVALMTEAKQRELAQAINGLTDKKKINQLTSEALGAPPNRRHVKAADAAASFIRQLDKHLEDLADRVDQVNPRVALQYLPTLARGAEMIQRLTRRAHGTTGKRQSGETVA